MVAFTAARPSVVLARPAQAKMAARRGALVRRCRASHVAPARVCPKIAALGSGDWSGCGQSPTAWRPPLRQPHHTARWLVVPTCAWGLPLTCAGHPLCQGRRGGRQGLGQERLRPRGLLGGELSGWSGGAVSVLFARVLQRVMVEHAEQRFSLGHLHSLMDLISLQIV